ncbi:MAG: hypothetical protein K2M55_04790 [Muribaculaceae bacterium]|nr:hypothetical protein [Muribaculaceae bacterium]
MTGRPLTRIAHTRFFAGAIALAATVCACIYFFTGHTVPLTADYGLGLPSANLWFSVPVISLAAAFAAGIGTIVAMTLLNKIYNVLRSMTMLFAAFFTAMQIATPDIATQFFTGSLLAVVVPACLLLLFSCYKSSDASRRVFIIFFVLSALTATQYCYAIYLIASFAGLGQMRIFNLRNLLASLMGIVTPWILLLGFGIVSPSEIDMPELASIFAALNLEDAVLLVATVSFTAAVTLLLYIINVVRTIAYNARARAFNGSFTLVLLLTLAAMCADYQNIIAYLPLFNFSCAMEMAHFFSTHRGDKTFIAIFGIIAVYFALFLCQIVI